jgi:cytochrome c55X
MPKKIHFILVTIATAVITGVTFASEGLTQERQAELANLLEQDCGSCHGSLLKGGLGPSLLPDALQGKSAEFLKKTILDGRPNTAMPPWRPLLSEADVDWLTAELLQENTQNTDQKRIKQ